MTQPDRPSRPVQVREREPVEQRRRLSPILAGLFPASLLFLVLLSPAPALAAPAPDRVAVLRQGVNITNWFRFPASLSPTALRGYMGDAAMADLRLAGFTFVRLAVQPEILLSASGGVDGQRVSLVTEAAARFQRNGLGVIVELHPVT